MKRIIALPTTALPAAAVASSACMTARFALGEGGADTSSLRIGATRGEIEGSFGKPVQEWDSRDGTIEYAAYVYDAGRPPRRWKALFFLPLDLLSLGLTDPSVATPTTRPTSEEMLRHETSRVVVGYDQAGKVSEILERSESFHR